MSHWLDYFKSKEQLIDSIQQFESVRVLIVGDVGLDEYVFGDVDRISPEAPVPVVAVHKEDLRLGLSSNVAANVSSLGGEPILMGIVGNDETSNRLNTLLRENQVKPDHLIYDKKRPTTKKVRILAGTQQVVRVDYEKKSYLEADIEKEILENVEKHLSTVDGVIIQDYAKGMISENLCQNIIQLAHKNKTRVLVDPHRSTPTQYYKNADLFKPNRDEAIILSGHKISEWRNKHGFIDGVAKELLKEVECENLILTEGKKGMNLYNSGEKVSFPTFAREVYDVSGAGDTVIATLALGWLSGLSLEQSCVLANFAAGVVVGQVGSIPCQKSELIKFIQKTKA